VHILFDALRQREIQVKVKIIGIGSALRKDDSIGIKIANELDLEGVECTECSCGLGLLHAMEGCDAAVIVDAVDFGGEPGETKVMKTEDLPRNSGETHTMDLGRIMNLVDLVEGNPEILIFGVQPADVGFGDSLSGELSRAMSSIEHELERLIKGLAR
jgi:hydrogenase maturation protease